MAYASVLSLVWGNVDRGVQQAEALAHWYQCSNEAEDDAGRDGQEQMAGVCVLGRDLMMHFHR
jgi:hypothetical protein